MFKSITELFDTAQVRELDRVAIEEFKIPGHTLMERAGAATFAALQEKWPKINRIVVVAGKGNNGGDGYVIAKLAKAAGMSVKLLFSSPPASLEGDAQLAARECEKANVTMMPFEARELADAELIVDALLGSGLTGQVREEFKNIITAINASKTPVLAVDIPSGLDANTGNPLGVAVKADLSVTFVGAKKGLFSGKAADFCGDILYTDLEVPDEVFTKVNARAELLTLTDLEKHLPPRDPTAHKGNFGHVLVVGGDYGMPGAVIMAAQAAARTGAGITTVATRPEHVEAVVKERPELMCYGVSNGRDLQDLINRATTIIIGPGLGQSAWSKELFAEVIKSKKPMVVDADALNILATEPRTASNWILTPHPGEAARLLETTVAGIGQDRFLAAEKLREKFGGVVVLKGAGTLVAGLKSKIGVCPVANPALATGGMGDVLSGIIGGLLAQGVEIVHAACFAVTIHGLAGQMAAQREGERGLLATDLLPYVRKLVNYANTSL